MSCTQASIAVLFGDGRIALQRPSLSETLDVGEAAANCLAELHSGTRRRPALG
jgi:hypothetical protein